LSFVGQRVSTAVAFRHGHALPTQGNHHASYHENSMKILWNRYVTVMLTSWARYTFPSW
jgi:hypothetical protein